MNHVIIFEKDIIFIAFYSTFYIDLIFFLFKVIGWLVSFLPNWILFF